MTTRGPRRLVPAVALVLALAGCSDDGDGGSGGGGGGGSGDGATPSEPSAATVRPALVALWTGSGGGGDTATAECFADALLERVEPAELVEAGVLDVDGAARPDRPSLDPATAEAWVDAQFACTDFVEESTRALTAQSKGRLDGRTYARCLRGAITDAEVREAVAQSLQGRFEDPSVARLAEAQRDCATRATPRD